jgi:hypothetical protein
MKGSRIFCVLLLLCAGIPSVAIAQDDPAEAEKQAQAELARQQYEAQRLADQERAIRDKSIAEMNRFLNDSYRQPRIPTSAAAELQAKFFEFRQSIPRFRAATDEYRWAVSLDSKLDKPLKNIAAQADVMLRYLSLTKVKHPPPDAAEFKDYSQAELVWETLNSAERIGTYLDLAVAVERQDIVAPAMLEFMYRLDGELLRLKWLTAHTKG